MFQMFYHNYCSFAHNICVNDIEIWMRTSSGFLSSRHRLRANLSSIDCTTYHRFTPEMSYKI